ncbi:MAG TPA: hypothetical protein VGX28_02595 [Frankiaceae bacterium]|jgi:hypothetical protein|nr:hypothetical protein [Frankiaceae bacterium]
MTRLLLLPALVAGALAVPAVAAPTCQGGIDTDCWYGIQYCRVYVAALRSCAA